MIPQLRCPLHQQQISRWSTGQPPAIRPLTPTRHPDPCQRTFNTAPPPVQTSQGAFNTALMPMQSSQGTSNTALMPMQPSQGTSNTALMPMQSSQRTFNAAPLPMELCQRTFNTAPPQMQPCQRIYHVYKVSSDIPAFPLDLGIDLNSIRTEISDCKRRFLRDLWSVLCSKALNDEPRAARNNDGWKKSNRDDDSNHGRGGRGGHKNRNRGAGSTMQRFHSEEETDDTEYDEELAGHNIETEEDFENDTIEGEQNENNADSSSVLRTRRRKSGDLKAPRHNSSSRRSAHAGSSRGRSASSRTGPGGSPYGSSRRMIGNGEGPAQAQRAAPVVGRGQPEYWNNWDNYKHWQQQLLHQQLRQQQQQHPEEREQHGMGDWNTAPHPTTRRGGRSDRQIDASSCSSVGFSDRSVMDRVSSLLWHQTPEPQQPVLSSEAAIVPQTVEERYPNEPNNLDLRDNHLLAGDDSAVEEANAAREDVSSSDDGAATVPSGCGTSSCNGKFIPLYCGSWSNSPKQHQHWEQLQRLRRQMLSEQAALQRLYRPMVQLHQRQQQRQSHED